MISTEVTVGDRELIDSGIVTPKEGEEVEIKLVPDHDDRASLTFQFRFSENEEYDQPGVETNLINDNAIEYHLVNHYDTDENASNPTPRKGLVHPVEVGEMANKKLYMNYQVSRREADDGAGVDFYYSFYLGGEVDE